MPQDVGFIMARGVNGIASLNERQIQIVSVTSMLTLLSTLAVCLRFVSRRLTTSYISMDDYLIVFALVRETTLALLCKNLISVSRCCPTEYAFVNSSASETALAANINEGNS